jgi:hypothetical protein
VPVPAGFMGRILGQTATKGVLDQN